MKAEITSLFKIFFSRTYKHVIWEITNACNCSCAMCGLWQKKPSSVDIRTAEKLIDLMHKNNVIYIQLTGGEPLLYKDLIPLIEYIYRKKIIIHLATNGTLLTEEYADKLKKAGLKYICISLDHYEPEIHDSVRGHKGCFSKAIEAVRILKDKNFFLYSSSIINKYNYKNLKTFIRFVNSLGISFGACFPYPDFNKNDRLSNLSDNDLTDAIKELIELKNKGYNIANTNAYLTDCLRFVEKKEARYPCLAGSRIFGLKIDEFRTCWMKKDNIFNLETGWKEKGINCNECQLACFREASAFIGLEQHNRKELFKEFLNFFNN